MAKEKCVTKYCRNPVELIYLGQPMCQTCYEKQCELEDQEYIGRNELLTQTGVY